MEEELWLFATPSSTAVENLQQILNFWIHYHNFLRSRHIKTFKFYLVPRQRTCVNLVWRCNAERYYCYTCGSLRYTCDVITVILAKSLLLQLQRHYCYTCDVIIVTLATSFHVQWSYTPDITGIIVVYSETRQHSLDTKCIYTMPKKYKEN